MRKLSNKEQGELNFWIDYVNGGCEHETGRPFLFDCEENAKGRMAYFCPNLPPSVVSAHSVWVDVGCGPYSVLLQAPPQATRIMIDPLMKFYQHHNLVPMNLATPRSIFLESPGENLPLGDATADVVFTTNTLDHVEDPRVMIRECARVLKCGGVLCLEVDTEGITDELHPHDMSAEDIDSEFGRFGMKRVFRNLTTTERRPGSRLYYAIYQSTENTSALFPKAQPPSKEFFRPILVGEGVRGFNIVRLRDLASSDSYYAIHQNDGAFYLSKIINKQYPLFFEGKSHDEVATKIHQHFDAQS